MNKTSEVESNGCGAKRVAKPIKVSQEAEKKLSLSIREWYTDAYYHDGVGMDIFPNVTFMDIVKALNERKNVYIFGVDDSLIRERIFEEIAARLGIKYDDIYDLWLADEIVG